jgi:hypothetical protein
MNLWEYLAFGGLERVLLIGAAILISYWGYHLYSKAQIAGLSMIAVAALLLMSVVLTSGQHQQSVNASLLSANTPSSPSSPQPVIADPVIAEVLEAAALDTPAAPQTPAALTEESATYSTTMTETSIDTDASSSPFVDESMTADELTTPEIAPTLAQNMPTDAEPAASSQAPRIERLVPLASGSELGGQIVSVRSENVTLEWSAGDSRRRVISESSPQ